MTHADKQIISRIETVPGSVEGTVVYALFEMVNGRVVLTPCDSEGNVIEAGEA